MSKSFALLAVSIVLGLVVPVFAAEPAADRAQNWPTWRGPNFNGVAPQGNPPTEWSDDSNIKWKVEIPGLGNATPIIWNDRIFILTAIDTGASTKEAGQNESGNEKKEDDKAAEVSERKAEAGKDQDESADPPKRGRGPRGRGGPRGGRGGGRGMRSEAPTSKHQFVVLCLNRVDGKEIWRRVAKEAVPHEGFRVGDNSYASGSPITDGHHLYVSFGSYGVFCFDLDGKQLWEKNLGKMETRNGFGEGSSPMLHGDRVVVNWDHEGDSFIVALDAATGDQKWKVERDEKTSWATPLVVESNGHTQVIVNATNRVRSYDLADGSLIWECGGQTTNAIPSPLLFGENVIVMSGFRGSAVFSIPLSSKGDLTESEKLTWHLDGNTSYRPGTPYVPSALLYDDTLYFLKSNDAILTSMSAVDGKVHYDKKRLEGLRQIYASPVGAAGRVYITGRDGTTAVLKHGTEFELIAKNSLDEKIDASPAIVGGELYLRGKQHLYCIATK